MLFIDAVMRQIWKTSYEEYVTCLKKYDSCSTDFLHDICKQDIKKLNEQVFKTEHHCLTILETIGCQHQIRKNGISGCAFCNWDSERIEEIARLKKLQEKDEKLYAEIIKESFVNIRGPHCHPELIEQISVHNIFDSTQFPNQAFELIFGTGNTYSTRPQLGIISARADYVNEIKVKQWKKAFCRNLTIGIGMEVGNEWLRNHWLNKQISDNQLREAMQCIKENGASVCFNIILGIPGLDEYNSLLIFRDTCRAALEMGADYILISPLITKQQTLGDILGENKAISTTLFWNAISLLKKEFSAYHHKFTYSPDNLKEMITFHGKEFKKQCEQLGIYNKVYADSAVFNHGSGEIKNVALRQENSIKNNLIESAREINYKLWGNDYKWLKAFEEEIMEFKEERIR